MNKRIIIGVVLILLAGGAWLYLDYLNKQQQAEAEEMRQAMIQAHARAAALQQAKAKFEAQILSDLNNCKAAAEKANTDYITAHQKPVRHKPGQFNLPRANADEAAKTLEAANAACQQAYETRLKNGS
jgi:hypothetical protein